MFSASGVYLAKPRIEAQENESLTREWYELRCPGLFEHLLAIPSVEL